MTTELRPLLDITKASKNQIKHVYCAILKSNMFIYSIDSSTVLVGLCDTSQFTTIWRQSNKEKRSMSRQGSTLERNNNRNSHRLVQEQEAQGIFRKPREYLVLLVAPVIHVSCMSSRSSKLREILCPRLANSYPWSFKSLSKISFNPSASPGHRRFIQQSATHKNPAPTQSWHQWHDAHWLAFSISNTYVHRM